MLKWVSAADQEGLLQKSSSHGVLEPPYRAQAGQDNFRSGTRTAEAYYPETGRLERKHRNSHPR